MAIFLCSVLYPHSHNSVICTDKTGTLTKGEMTAVRLWFHGDLYKITGGGYEPVVSDMHLHFHNTDTHLSRRELSSPWTLLVRSMHASPSCLSTTSCRSSLQVEARRQGILVSRRPQSACQAGCSVQVCGRLCVPAFWLCLDDCGSDADVQLVKKTHPETGVTSEVWDAKGNMSERPLVVAGMKIDINRPDIAAAYPSLHTNTFQSIRKMMSRLLDMTSESPSMS